MENNEELAKGIADKVSKLRNALAGFKQGWKAPPNAVVIPDRRGGLRDIKDLESLSAHPDAHDFMVPEIGNKQAFQQLQRMVPAGKGVWLSMDGNKFKSINESYGHGAGDDAIKLYGQAVHNARQGIKGKHFVGRNGGDEFVAWFDNEDDAHQFYRNLRSNMDLIPPHIGEDLAWKPDVTVHPRTAKKMAASGKKPLRQHFHSLSVGMASDFDTADKVALPEAKTKSHLVSHSAKAQPGQERTNAVHARGTGEKLQLHEIADEFAEDLIKHEYDLADSLELAARLSKTVPMFDGPSTIEVYAYMRPDGTIWHGVGDFAHGWLDRNQVPETTPELRKSGYILVSYRTKQVYNDEAGVIFRT